MNSAIKTTDGMRLMALRKRAPESNLKRERLKTSPRKSGVSGLWWILLALLCCAGAKAECGAVKDVLQQSGRQLPKVAMFDESIEWAMSRAATDEIVAFLKKSGIPVYVPVVWHGRGTYYPTERAHQDTRLLARLAKKDDPLAYLISKAHENGIEVHAWFTVVKREDEKYSRFYSAGTPKGAFDLHSVEFREFITKMILEAGKNYELDGINLDYIRSMGLCTSRTCAEAYGKHAGRDLSIDLKRRYLPHVRKAIGDWNRAAIEEILTKIRSGLAPACSLSVDAHPLNRVTEEQGQFAVDWANADLVDRIYDMRYQDALPIEELRKIEAALNDSHKLWVLISNATKTEEGWVARSVGLMEKQLNLLGTSGFSGGIGIWHRPRTTASQAELFSKRWANQ